MAGTQAHPATATAPAPTSHRPRRAGGRGGDSGAAALAAAVLGAVLVLLPMILIQAAVYFHARNVAASASRHALEATRVAEGTPAAGQAAGLEYLAQAGGPLTDTDVDTSRGATTANATVQGEVTSLVPGLQLTVSVTVTGPVERFEP